jgi:ATP adenylyltransferase
MDRLWTPWRYSYVTNSLPGARRGVPPELAGWPSDFDTGCVFCNMIAAVDYAIAQGMAVDAAEKAAHIVLRGPLSFTCLNAFPYASGHVLILPYAHQASLAELAPATAQEIMATAQRIETALRKVYRPDGINIGINLGQAAGAGVAEHLHMHALPRWFGDTNFMTVVSETRVLPELLETAWSRLRSELGAQ